MSQETQAPSCLGILFVDRQAPSLWLNLPEQIKQQELCEIIYEMVYQNEGERMLGYSIWQLIYLFSLL